MFRIFAVALVVSIASAAASIAAPLRTFYVDPAGNDAAAGSITSPWRTLQKAANTVRAGDLVIVRAGHYAGLYLTTSGMATDPITFRGDPGAVVDTQNPTTPDGIKQVHLAELRAALAAVYAARGLSSPAWTDATIAPAATVVRAIHITELRAAVLALE